MRHEIVHNRHVVESLKAKGAIFVEELDEIPETGCARDLFGTRGAAGGAGGGPGPQHVLPRCHLPAGLQGARRGRAHHQEAGLEIVLIGHAGHPEVIGTLGQLPAGCGDADRDGGGRAPLRARAIPQRLAYITQTTLSVDDTAAIVAVLKARFPAIVGPRKEDICYATTNRQAAVKAIAPRCDALIVVGAPNSSNSLRLVEVAERAGCPKALLVQRAADIPWDALRRASPRSASRPAPRRRSCW